MQRTGLQALTSDISKLVNLVELHLEDNPELQYIPDEISCLQSLSNIWISGSSVITVSAGLAMLATLDCLDLMGCDGVSFPPNLQVIDLGCWHSRTFFWKQDTAVKCSFVSRALSQTFAMKGPKITMWVECVASQMRPQNAMWPMSWGCLNCQQCFLSTVDIAVGH